MFSLVSVILSMGVCLVPSNFWGVGIPELGIPEGDGVRIPEGVSRGIPGILP